MLLFSLKNLKMLLFFACIVSLENFFILIFVPFYIHVFFFFFPAAFKISFLLVLSNLITLVYLSLCFWILEFVEFLDCGFVVFIKIGKFWLLFFQHFFCVPSFLRKFSYIYVRVFKFFQNSKNVKFILIFFFFKI